MSADNNSLAPFRRRGCRVVRSRMFPARGTFWTGSMETSTMHKSVSHGVAFISRAARCESGAAAVEFALVLPLLMILLHGIYVFGMTFSNYIVVTSSTQAAVLQLTISRGSNTPLTDTKASVVAIAQSLNPDNITITTKVNGTACTTDGQCKTALASAAGLPAAVTVSYPCNIRVMGQNFAPSCNLASSAIGRIQ